MASKRISELPAAGALDGSEQIPLTQNGETRRIPSNTYPLRRVIDVEQQHGAVGDGSALDTQPILDAVAAASPGDAILLLKHHLIDDQIPWKTGVAIVCHPGGTTVTMDGSSTTRAFYFRNISDVTVLGDLVVDMNKANTADGGSGFDQQGLYVRADNGGACRNLHFGRTRVVNAWYRGALFVAANPDTDGDVVENFTVDRVEANNCGLRGWQFLRCNNFHVTRPDIDQCHFGMEVNQCTDWSVSDPSCRDSVHTGLRIAECSRWTITGSSDLSDNGDGSQPEGYGLSLGPLCSDFAIGDVVADNCQESGVTVDVADGDSPDTMQDINGSIGNVVTRNCGSHGFRARRGQGLSIASLTTEGNTLSGAAINLVDYTIGSLVSRNNGAWGLDLQDAGSETPNPGNGWIGARSFSGNTDGDIRDDHRGATRLSTTGLPLRVPLGDMIAVNGTVNHGTIDPTGTAPGRRPARLFPSGTSPAPRGGFEARVPKGTKQIRLRFYWTRTGTSGTNVRWQVNHAESGDGEAMGETSSITNTTLAAPTQWVRDVFESDPITVDDTKIQVFQLIRGTASSDEATDDMAVTQVDVVEA